MPDRLFSPAFLRSRNFTKKRANVNSGHQKLRWRLAAKAGGACAGIEKQA
jgi:hypothetical protein